MNNSYPIMIVYGRTSDIRLSRICDLFGFQLRVRGEKQVARAQLLCIIYCNIKKRRTKLWQLDNISNPLPKFKEITILQFGGVHAIRGQ
jgi:hypothetical protein